MSASDPYVDPKTGVLRNKFGIRKAADLDYIERELVTQREAEGIPAGQFDLAHLRAIHRHLFQDVYEWAGEVRMVEISKAGTQFQAMRYIETGMDDVHRRLVQSDFLRNLKRPVFASQAGVIIGDINHVHPFREGNGRTQLLYLKLLAEQAGHGIDLTRLSGPDWIAASRAANRGEYDGMRNAIAGALK